MMSIFRRTSTFACVATLSLAAASASAQGLPHANYYEMGVGAYFAGHSCEAEQALSLAIQANAHDPRAYYFRAFSLLRQGRLDEARGDMMLGAQIEATQPQRYAVGNALERVQGSCRLMLEQYRRRARYEAAPAQAGTAQGGIIRPGENEVLRENRTVPIEELLRPEGPRAVIVQPTDEAPMTPPQPNVAAPPVVPPQPAEKVDPFGDDAAKADAPEAPKTTTPEAPKATPPVPPQDENPF
jgi:hypothetical protein